MRGTGWKGYRQLGILTLFFALGGVLPAQTLPSLAAVRIANGFNQPLFVTAPPQDYSRLFVVTKGGLIYVVNLPSGAVNTTPFLDLSSRVATDSEEGLVGLAFDPNFATNGKFYCYFVVKGGTTFTPANGTSRISQFQLLNANQGDPTSEKLLLSFDQPQANHNGGWIGFSPRVGDENNLYIASGDGGNGDDADNGNGHIEPGGNAQNLTTLLGKMLRIHVDAATGTKSIPASNPFVGTTGARPEIFTYGMRNPFRCSFDRATGDLFIGDVGQNTREEVDVQKASNPGGGENYGWRIREGTIQNPNYPNPPNVPPANAVDPIIDYGRSTGGTVTGGYVYRGKQIPDLRGTYVFGDYLVSKIFTLNFNGSAASNFQDITSRLFPTASGGYSLSGPASFGEDANGEIYIVAINTGSIFKIVPTVPYLGNTAVLKVPGGSIFVAASGVPFQTYTIQSTNSLVQPFTFLANATATGDGVISYEDPNPGTQRFYRVTP